MDETKINISTDKDTLTILEGQALTLREPVKLDIKGIIDTPHRFIENRLADINASKSHIIVNREDLSIQLVMDETSFYSGSVVGKLEHHPDFAKWKIGEGYGWSHKTLSEFIKMNRSAFEVQEEAMSLSSELRTLKVKTDTEIEKDDDNKGNKKTMVIQKIIESSIPDSFNVYLPIFKGQKAVLINVEIYVDPSSFNVALVSPEVNDSIASVRDTVIDEELVKIKKTFATFGQEFESKEIVIIES